MKTASCLASCILRFAVGLLILLNTTKSEAAMERLQTKRERMDSLAQGAKIQESLYPKIHESFLKQDYLAVDRLSKDFLLNSKNEEHRQDVLYLQALALLKLNRAFEARVKLRELENSFELTDDKAAASASLGDSYYYAGDSELAYENYKTTFEKYPNSNQSSYVLYKLLELSQKLGRPGQAGFYKTSLLHDYASSRESADARTRFAAVPEPDPLHVALRQMSFEEKPFFSVQVGSFSSQKNARELLRELLSKHFEAYLERDQKNNRVRVRVGKCASHEDAEKLSDRLKQEGYPTKICP